MYVIASVAIHGNQSKRDCHATLSLLAMTQFEEYLKADASQRSIRF